MVTQPTKWIGQSVTRLEDPPLVTGRGRYAGDISFPHQLHMRVVRSHVASGRIVAIDTSAAKAVPGVFAVWSAADIPDAPPIDFREGRIEKLEPYRQPVLATDRVRYVGDPIAAVFAEDPYIAEDAADLVTVDIEELPVLLHAQAEPGEFSPGRSTEAAIVRQGYGDLDAAFRAAHAVVELELSVGRHSGVPIETRGAIGRYDAARDMLELHGAAKIPHANRNLLARMLKRAPSAISLHESHVGGGFGVRGELYPEDVLVLIAAMRLGRPVKWIEDRREHLMCAAHSRQQTHKLRAAVDREGHILAIDDEFWHDQGAYLRTHAIRVAMMICGFLPGPYRVPAYRSIGHVRLTNKTPAATYRAPGRFETTFIRERMMEAIACRLGLDSIEVRRRNTITKAEMPYSRPLEPLGEEIHHDTGDYLALLDKVLAAADWESAQRAMRAAACRGRACRCRRGDVRGEERAWPLRRREDFRRYVGRGRGRHRRRVDRTGFRDGDRAGVRGDARRRLPPHPRRPRADRQDRVWNRCPCVPRNRDDGVGNAQHRARGPSKGPRIRRRNDAGAGRVSHDRGRKSGSNRSRGRRVDEPRRNCRRAGADLEDARRARPGTVGRRLVPRRPASLPLWQPCGDGAGRRATPAPSRSSATSSATISVAPSIRCW